MCDGTESTEVKRERETEETCTTRVAGATVWEPSNGKRPLDIDLRCRHIDAIIPLQPPSNIVHDPPVSHRLV